MESGTRVTIRLTDGRAIQIPLGEFESITIPLDGDAELEVLAPIWQPMMGVDAAVPIYVMGGGTDRLAVMMSKSSINSWLAASVPLARKEPS